MSDITSKCTETGQTVWAGVLAEVCQGRQQLLCGCLNAHIFKGFYHKTNILFWLSTDTKDYFFTLR